MPKPADRRINKGYKVTSNQIDAIFGGLLSTGGGIAKELTDTQSRDLAAIARVAAKGTRAAKGSVAKTAKQATSRYGSAMGGAVETALAPSKAAAKATGVVAKAGLGAARTTAQAGQLALDIQQSAAAEAKSAADYAAAVALSERVAAREAETTDQTGTGSQNFQSASQSLSEAATTLDYAGAQSLLESFKYTYGLGPKAMAKLSGQLGALYPTTDPQGLSNINQAEAEGGPTNQFGEPYVWEGSPYQTKVKKTVAQAVNAALRGDVNDGTGEEWTLQDIKDGVLSMFTAEDGTYTVPDSIIQAALAYAEHVWVNNTPAIEKGPVTPPGEVPKTGGTSVRQSPGRTGIAPR